MREVSADTGAKLAEFNATANHVHLVNFRPRRLSPAWSTASRKCPLAGSGRNSGT